MGRPRRVIFENFVQYDKFHTTKQKMYSGVEMTVLYPIKETAQYWMSPEVWAYCASQFRMKKKNLSELSVNIPTITDQKTIDFLKEHCWEDWVTNSKKESEMKETISYLKKVYPNHEVVFFYELDSLLSAYNQGAFSEDLEKGDFKQAKYYNRKYSRFTVQENPEVKLKYEAYSNHPEEDKKGRSLKYKEYAKMEEDIVWKDNNHMDIFMQIGQSSVCFPVAFSKGTAEWAIEKYGKPMAYSNAGEIFFVVTPDRIYFETKRHY